MWMNGVAETGLTGLRGNDPGQSRPPIPPRVKAAVLERDWPNCQICGGLIALGEQHLDHIKPFSMGGEDTVENLRLTHDLCNMRRGTGRCGFAALSRSSGSPGTSAF